MNLRIPYLYWRITFSCRQNLDARSELMTADPVPTEEAGGEVTILLDRKKVSVTRMPGETLLESARRAGLTPPFSCEAGNCGTCMAKLTDGSATMRINDALMDDEVADGYVLTCQAVPDTANVTVDYED
jgi:ferredoxin